MKIEELKSKIENKSIDNSPLIFVYKDNGRIICDQYIDEICKIRNLDKHYCDDTINDDFGILDMLGLIDDSNYLYVVYTDNFLSSTVKPNHIICCHQVSKDVKKLLDDIIVEIPKLEDWQLKCYAQGVVSGLSEDRLDWFCANCKDDFKFINEINRLKIFADSIQNDVFDSMVDDGFFDDLIDTSIFELSTAIQRKDPKAVYNVLSNMNIMSLNPIALNNLLYSSFKDIMTIKLSPSALPQTVDITPKKFNALKYYVNYFTKEQLVKILKLLSSTDYKIKTGQLQTNILIDYLITNILAM